MTAEPLPELVPDIIVEYRTTGDMWLATSTDIPDMHVAGRVLPHVQRAVCQQLREARPGGYTAEFRIIED